MKNKGKQEKVLFIKHKKIIKKTFKSKVCSFKQKSDHDRRVGEFLVEMSDFLSKS